ncbi:MAG: diaminopimelate epimerase [Oscillospiraceae bacterium]
MIFYKMHGNGNDFVFIDCFSQNVTFGKNTVRRICDRHLGVGADGVIFMRKSTVSDVKMVIFNADGTRASMCGNGLLCIARLLSELGYTAKSRVCVETDSGLRTCSLLTSRDGQRRVEADMGIVSVSGGVLEPICFSDSAQYVTKVHAGNSHAVFFTGDVSKLDLKTIGSLVCDSNIFSEEVNAEFCEVIGDNRLKVRVFERGVGETLACGTGACAAALAGTVRGFCDTRLPIEVKMPGGTLSVRLSGDSHALLTGTVELVFRGDFDL